MCVLLGSFTATTFIFDIFGTDFRSGSSHPYELATRMFGLVAGPGIKQISSKDVTLWILGVENGSAPGHSEAV